jgi:hypothetical protein
MGLGWIAAAGVAGVASAGCQLQGQCDASAVVVGGDAGESGATTQRFQPGAGVYATGSGAVWQSSPIEGTWMDFPPERTYTIYPKLPDGGPFLGPWLLTGDVSPDPSPATTQGSNFANLAGNLGEFEQDTATDGGRPTYFTITNETCSPYWVWVSATQEYADTDGGLFASEAGSDSSAGNGDGNATDGALD